MKLSLLFILLFFFVQCYSQNILNIYSIEPNWDNDSPINIKIQNIRCDSVYFYKKRKNNKDSTLRMTQYFDSLGNLIERDEYNLKGEVFRIINYTYWDSMLVKQDILTKGLFYINDSDISKKVKTYDHDSLGNIVEEKEYFFSGDPLKLFSTTIWDREYDSLGNLTKEFE